MSWVPLNVHSQFSILDSTASVTALANKAKALSVPALALTDQGNLYGAVDFYKACKAAKVKPIFGCEIWMAPASRLEKKRIPGMRNGFPIVLLAKDATGYRNLCKLSSIGFWEGFYYEPRIDKEILSQYAQGLICLSGPLSGPIAYQILQENEEELSKEIQFYRNLFGEDFYFEIQRHPLQREVEESWLLQKMQSFVENQKREPKKKQKNKPKNCRLRKKKCDKISKNWKPHKKN